MMNTADQMIPLHLTTALKWIKKWAWPTHMEVSSNQQMPVECQIIFGLKDECSE